MQPDVDMQLKLQQFLNDRKYVNNIVDLINLLRNDEADQSECMRTLQELFSTILKRGDFVIDRQLQAVNAKAFEVEEKYVNGLNNLYEKTWTKLLSMLEASSEETQKQALTTIMSLLASDSRRDPSKGHFPLDKLQRVLIVLLSSEEKFDQMIFEFSEYFIYKDITFYTWKILKDLLMQSTDEADLFTYNILTLVEKMALSRNSKSQSADQLLCFDDPNNFSYHELTEQKWIQRVWMKLTNRRLNIVNHKKLLMVLLENYLSHLRKPRLLADFLFGSLGMGGAVGLLALQGISTLVMKHNLDCPNIFEKLYNMFQPDMINSRYKPRLFYLADLFLQSTYISEHLVAAFAKRLSRLTLTAQAPDIILILQFIGNLLIRHRALISMIQHPVGESVDSDPFIMEETDPLKSRAIESSLWEIALLKNHVQPKVSSAAKFIDSSLPTVEWDITNVLEGSYSKMFDAEMKKFPKAEPSLTFVRPVTLAQHPEDHVYKMWTLT